MYDLFVSYSHNDKAFAKRLCTDIKKRGASVWIDTDELKIGDSLIERIHEGLKSSLFFAVLISRSSVDSRWVRHELKTAITEEIKSGTTKVLPIVIEECEIPGFLSDKVYADMRDDESYQENIELILERITGISRAGLGSETDTWSSALKGLSIERCFEKLAPSITESIVKQVEMLTFEQRTQAPFKELVSAGFVAGVSAIERYHSGLLIPIEIFVRRRVTHVIRKELGAKIQVTHTTSPAEYNRLVDTIWKVLGSGELDDDGKQWWIRAVNGLPEISKKVFVLYFYEQLTIDEVSHVLAKLPAEITKILSQGIDQLKPIIRELGE